MTPSEKYIDSIKGKKVAFVGMGVANTPCAEFLAKNGIETYACDMRDKEYIGADVCRHLEELGVHFSLGEGYTSNGYCISLSRNTALSKQVDWRMY